MANDSDGATLGPVSDGAGRRLAVALRTNCPPEGRGGMAGKPDACESDWLASFRSAPQSF